MSSRDLKLHLTAITYGAHGRRAEIELRPTIPDSARADPTKIDAWVQNLSMSIAKDIKHTNEWECTVCGKLARESKYNVVFMTHLPQPRAIFYIYNVCAAGENPCNQITQAENDMVLAIAGTTPNPRVAPPAVMSEHEAQMLTFPLASSCAKCRDAKTGQKGYKLFRCGGCKLTRYCCPGCQKADWGRHKKACKIIESVNWVW